MATTTDKYTTVRSDPLRNFKFHVSITSHNSKVPIGTMGFMSVGGLNISTEVIPYREGGMNTTTQKLPGQTDFAPITLQKGLIVGENRMMDWMREMFAVVQGTGTGAPGNNFRASMLIKVLDHPVTTTTAKKAPVKAMYRVYKAWPTSISMSDLDAGANAIIVQQITFAHEGFEFALDDGTGNVKFPGA